MISFDKIKRYTDKIAHFYGSEDLCIHLYSWIKMIDPKLCLELGTGLGSTALWLSTALKENESGGILHTVDNGFDWNDMREHLQLEGFSNISESYEEHICNLIKEFNLKDNIEFYNSSVDQFNSTKLQEFQKNSIDLLFIDYRHGPVIIIQLLSEYLPYMSENSMIFIDSAPTYYQSYSMLKDLIFNLNNNKNIKSLLSWSKYPEEVKEKISLCRFELFNIFENKNRDQNSTACIRLSSNDVFPPLHLTIRGI